MPDVPPLPPLRELPPVTYDNGAGFDRAARTARRRQRRAATLAASATALVVVVALAAPGDGASVGVAPSKGIPTPTVVVAPTYPPKPTTPPQPRPTPTGSRRPSQSKAEDASFRVVPDAAPDRCRTNQHVPDRENRPPSPGGNDWCMVYLGPTEVGPGEHLDVVMRICRSAAEGIGPARMTQALLVKMSREPGHLPEEPDSWRMHGSERPLLVDPGDCLEWAMPAFERYWLRDMKVRGVPPGTYYLTSWTYKPYFYPDYYADLDEYFVVRFTR